VIPLAHSRTLAPFLHPRRLLFLVLFLRPDARRRAPSASPSTWPPCALWRSTAGRSRPRWTDSTPSRTGSSWPKSPPGSRR